MNLCIQYILAFLLLNPLYTYSSFNLIDWAKSWYEWSRGIEELITTHEHIFEPRGTITIENKGSIVIEGWSVNKLICEVTRYGSEKQRDSCLLDIDFKSNRAHLKATFQTPSDILVNHHILAPLESIITIKNEGPLKIKRFNGSLTINNQGPLKLIDCIPQKIALTNKGPVTCRFKAIPLSSTIQITSESSIQLYLPHDIHATVHAKAAKDLFCEPKITLKPITVSWNEKTFNQLKHDLNGILGNGGPSISLISTHGSIKIFEY